MIKVFTIRFIKLPKKFKEISEINKEYRLGEASQLYFEVASRYPELANRQMKLEVFDSLKDQSYSIDVSFHLDLSLADLISEQINKTIAKTEDSEQLEELKKRLLTAFKTEILPGDREDFTMNIDESLQEESSQNEIVTDAINFDSLSEASPLTATDIAALALDETDLNVEGGSIDEGIKDGVDITLLATSEVNIADFKTVKKLGELKEGVKIKMGDEDSGVTDDLELLLSEIEECMKDISGKVSQKLTEKVNERIENVHTEVKGIENTLLEYIESARLEFDLTSMKDLSSQIDSLHDNLIKIRNSVTSLLEAKLDEMQAMTKKTNVEYYQLIAELTSDNT